MLGKFQMSDCHSVTTPFEPILHLDKVEEGDVEAVPYKKAIGSLTYMSQVTRADISVAVNTVSQYNSNPGISARDRWQSFRDANWEGDVGTGLSLHYAKWRNLLERETSADGCIIVI